MTPYAFVGSFLMYPALHFPSQFLFPELLVEDSLSVSGLLCSSINRSQWQLKGNLKMKLDNILLILAYNSVC